MMNFFKKIIPVLIIISIVLPYSAFAACPTGYVEKNGSCWLADVNTNATAGSCPDTPGNFSELVCILVSILNSLIPVIIGIGLIVFLWGLALFILAAGDEKKIESGKNLMIYGIIGLFVMTSVWGLIRVVYSTFFGGGAALLPLFERQGN